MKPYTLPLLMLAVVAALPLSAAIPTLSFDEVRPGMRGTGRTVFQGTEISTFDVEILGKLPDVGPEQDLILGRCSGGPLAETGVLSGMSGSPVFVDGKLIGAVAYSWGFAKEAIAGITPIDEMLAIAAEEDAAPAGGQGLLRQDLARLGRPGALSSFFNERLGALLRQSRGGVAFAPIPLAVAGLGQRGLQAIAPGLDRAGFVPLQSGGSASTPSPAAALQPGSAMGLKLVRGAVEMTATGTVTWVDGDRVLAFGHPLFGLGALDLPLTGAEVQALLPSVQQSVRIATPTAELGAVRQDRASGVSGTLRATAQMIPVRLQLNTSSGGEHTYSFDIADDPLLAPLLLYHSLNGILASRERGFGNATVRLRQGSVIRLAAREEVELDNLFSGAQAVEFGTGVPAYILYLLMNNAWTPPRVAGVNLILEYEDEPHTARIRRATLDRSRAHAGETLQATVIVSSYRGPDQVLSRQIKIPDETPPGRVRVQIGSAVAVSRTEETDQPLFPRDLEQLIRLINQLRRNDRIYIVGSGEAAGVLLGGSRLTNLPPSAASILTRPKSRGNVAVLPRHAIFEESVATEFAVDGWAELELEVLEP